LKSVSTGRRGKKRDVEEREEDGRTIGERRGEEKRKKKKKSQHSPCTFKV
jgi:hypothetical protein